MTVVLIVHNTAPWLEECIDSIAAQSFHDFEVVVVDVASNLATKRILARRWRSLRRPRLVAKLRNVGGAAAANAGIGHARGTFVFLMDSDDVLPRHALRALHAAGAGEDLDVVIGRGLAFVDGRPARMRYSADVITWARPQVSSSLRDAPHLTMAPFYWGRLYRRSMLVDHHIRMKAGRLFADRYFTCNTLKHSRRTGVVSEFTYFWRRDRGVDAEHLSITQRSHTLESVRDRIASFADVEELFHRPEDASLLRYVRLTNLMRLLIHSRQSAGDPEALREFVRVARPYAEGFLQADVADAEFLLSRHKVQWYLIAQGRAEDLASFLQHEDAVEPVADGGRLHHDYSGIVGAIPAELSWECRRRIGEVTAQRTVIMGGPALELHATVPAGMAIDPLYLVLRSKRVVKERRLPLQLAAGDGHYLATLPERVDPDSLPSLALEYIAGGRVATARVTLV